jgi:hypothetical protein
MYGSLAGSQGMVHNYTLGMNSPRTLPLFDSGAQPASWNERMSPGEYAVHYSSLIAVLWKRGQPAPFSETWQTRKNMPKHRWPSNPHFAAASMMIGDSLGRPSSKFGDSNT